MAKRAKIGAMRCRVCKDSGELWVAQPDEWQAAESTMILVRCWHCVVRSPRAARRDDRATVRPRAQ